MKTNKPKNRVVAFWIALAAGTAFPGLVQAQSWCIPTSQIAAVLEAPLPPSSSRSNRLNITLEATKPSQSKILDLTELSTSSIVSLRKKFSEVSSNDLIIISDKALANKPLMAELKKAKMPLILTVGDNSLTSRVRAQAMLGKKIKRISTVAVLPQDQASISKVWNTTSNPSAVAQMKRANARFAQLTNTTVITGPGKLTFKAQLLREIEAGGPEEMFVFVGHNDKGWLRGPDGTSISIQELSQELARRKRPGLILSCETAHSSLAMGPAVVTTNRLLPEQVANALNLVHSRLGTYSNPTYSDFLIEFSKAVQHGAPITERDIRILLSVAAGGVVTATVVYSKQQAPSNSASASSQMSTATTYP